MHRFSSRNDESDDLTRRATEAPANEGRTRGHESHAGKHHVPMHRVQPKELHLYEEQEERDGPYGAQEIL
jgi:hypothetical protein